MTERDSPAGPITVDTAESILYRIGHQPDPFSWTPWQYANSGLFDGRWDDPEGTYRTLYVGDSLLGCLLEVLADFRPDLVLLDDLDAIDDTDDQNDLYPTLRGGTIPASWLEPRCAGVALLHGTYVDVRTPITLATLRTRFGGIAAGMGLEDLDAAAVKANAPRSLTQAISGWSYRDLHPPITGICFASRFGDNLAMWAVFEQPGDDTAGTPALTERRPVQLDPGAPAFAEALRIHGLTWSSS